MAVKRAKPGRPVKVAHNFHAWLTQVARRLSAAEGRNVTLVEVTARLGTWLTSESVDSLADLKNFSRVGATS